MSKRHALNVSASALALAAGLSAALPGTAAAQTQPNLNANTLLQPFLGLTGQPGVLTSNLNGAVAINNGATTAQRSQAVVDNAITSDTGAVVADGLGTRLNSAYQSALVANNPLLSASGSVVQAFRQANGISQADSGFNKYFFANGTTDGATASSRANPNPNVYGQAYGNGTPADRFGDSRPFQVSPAINNYAPTITAGLVNNPAFPSGHTTFGYTQGLLFAQAVPETYQQNLTRASEYGNSRIVLGAHYPLDVIAGRIQATYDVAQLLNNNPAYLNQPISVFAVGNVTTSSDYASLFRQATTDLRSALSTGCGATIASCVAASGPDRFSNTAQDRTDYLARLTYGLPATGATNLAPVVPTGAEVLLATRLPYLTAAQRRDVLATTEIASGGALDNGSGWARLNLFDAASGYGAFNGSVTVTQDASLGGFNAADTFGNNIGGSGGLTKAGTGALTLAGGNSFAGGVDIQGGQVVAASITALGTGNVTVEAGGTLVDAVNGVLQAGGNLVEALGGLLQFNIDDPFGGSRGIRIGGSGSLLGGLTLNFLESLRPGQSESITFDTGLGLNGNLGPITVTGLNFPYTQNITRTANGTVLTVTTVPEPGSLLVLLGGLVAFGLLRRERGVRAG